MSAPIPELPDGPGTTDLPPDDPTGGASDRPDVPEPRDTPDSVDGGDRGDRGDGSIEPM